MTTFSGADHQAQMGLFSLRQPVTTFDFGLELMTTLPDLEIDGHVQFGIHFHF